MMETTAKKKCFSSKRNNRINVVLTVHKTYLKQEVFFALERIQVGIHWTLLTGTIWKSFRIRTYMVLFGAKVMWKYTTSAPNFVSFVSFSDEKKKVNRKQQTLKTKETDAIPYLNFYCCSSTLFSGLWKRILELFLEDLNRRWKNKNTHTIGSTMNNTVKSTWQTCKQTYRKSIQ